jgi:hypothetical protein
MRWFAAFAFLALSAGVLASVVAPRDVWITLEPRAVALVAGIIGAAGILLAGVLRARCQS